MNIETDNKRILIMKNLHKYLYAVATIMLCAACADDDYLIYDTTQKDSVFFEYIDSKEEVIDSVDYVFNYNIASSYTIEIPVRLMGMPVSHDRQIALKPVAELTDMVEGIHYAIESAVLPADSVKTTVKVQLLRDNDPLLQQRQFRLTLNLIENDDLRAVGEKQFTITYSDIRPESKPGWWSSYSPLPIYSFEAAQVFFKYFYENAPEANISIFNEMIYAYGDYFMNAGNYQGPFAMYDSFLIRWVLMPMYEDYKDVFEWQSVPSFY